MTNLIGVHALVWVGGTGRALLLTSLWRCREAGYVRASLAVTYENQRADLKTVAGSA